MTASATLSTIMKEDNIDRAILEFGFRHDGGHSSPSFEEQFSAKGISYIVINTIGPPYCYMNADQLQKSGL